MESILSEPFGFDPEFLKTLEYLSLVSRRVFRGSLLATRRSFKAGSGLEFTDHREYTETDDFRYLDWNLFARHGQMMVKRFHEEQDLHVYLLLDNSMSMRLGRPPKLDYARQVIAALAYIALADLDRVSVTTFAGNLGPEFPLSCGRDCMVRLLRFLEGLSTVDEPTDLARALTSFVARPRHQGLVLVVSDWFDRAGFVRGLEAIRHRNHEVHLIQVFDPAEAEPAIFGDYELIDIEPHGSAARSRSPSAACGAIDDSFRSTETTCAPIAGSTTWAATRHRPRSHSTRSCLR